MSMGRKPARGAIGDNGGPPLEEKPHVPEWGRGGPGNYFLWKKAHAQAWKAPSHNVLMQREARAAALGLTYHEYTLEILERGRHLTEDDVARIAEIKAARRNRRPLA
jgi:hypothetical protein